MSHHWVYVIVVGHVNHYHEYNHTPLYACDNSDSCLYSERQIFMQKSTIYNIQLNLSNLDTHGTISGVHFMEVSWFQGLVYIQIQHLGPQ